MYNIDSKVDKPDIQYMLDQVNKMMDRGIKVTNARKIYNNYKSKQDELTDIIREEYGIQNPNSPPQVVGYLKSLENDEVYDECFLDGKWTTKKDSLKALEELGYQFATDLLQYRQAKKYAESCKTLIDHMDENNLIRPKISLGKTNRVNYSEPPLMNIPKKLLWSLISPSKPTNKLFAADIKNQEPSIMINLLNIEQFKDALTDPKGLYETLFEKPFSLKIKMNLWVVPPNTDRNGVWEPAELATKEGIPPIYYSPSRLNADAYYLDGEKAVAVEALNTVVDIGGEVELPTEIVVHLDNGDIIRKEVDMGKIDAKKLSKTGLYEIEGTIKGVDVQCKGIVRDEFKVAWNAMTYGASSFGINKMCKHIDGKTVYKYFSGIKEFKQYRKQCTDLANKGIQNIRTYFGTLLYANESNPKALKRVLMDLPIQGTGSDILSMLIKHFNEETESRGLSDKMWIYYTRHDELIIEVDGEYLETVGEDSVKETLRDILEHKVDNWEPFKLEIDQVDDSNLALHLEDDED